MNNQTFDLNKMGLASMTEVELQKVDGGFWWTDLYDALKDGIPSFFEGFSAGYNSSVKS